MDSEDRTRDKDEEDPSDGGGGGTGGGAEFSGGTPTRAEGGSGGGGCDETLGRDEEGGGEEIDETPAEGYLLLLLFLMLFMLVDDELRRGGAGGAGAGACGLRPPPSPIFLAVDRAAEGASSARVASAAEAEDLLESYRARNRFAASIWMAISSCSMRFFSADLASASPAAIAVSRFLWRTFSS